MKNIGIYCMVLLFANGCQYQNQQSTEPIPTTEAHFNVLDYKGEPENTRDLSVFSFADLGAWHSYALPENKTMAGKFVGPYTMGEEWGNWTGTHFAALDLVVAGHSVLENNSIQQFNQQSSPGKLKQTFSTESLSVQMDLIFVSDRTAVQRTTIKNEGVAPIPFSGSYEGQRFKDTLFAYSQENPIVWENKKTGLFHVTMPVEQPFDLNKIENGYVYNFKETTLPSGETLELYFVNSVCFSLKEAQVEIKKWNTKGALQQAFVNNTDRWDAMLQSVRIKPEYNQKKWAELVKIKSIQTLLGNWKSATGGLPHDGLFPSYAYRGFYGFWSWDSWKHAVALLKFNPDLAKEQIRAMYAFQNHQGMIADCVYRDSIQENNNWRDTKPPLSGWAINKVFQQTKDTAFVRDLLPALEKYHLWWYKERDNDQNGLCEYGSTDGTRVAAAWESGMDNAVRFDAPVMVQNSAKAWSLTQESVDLNAYLYYEKLQLAALFLATGQQKKSNEYTAGAGVLKNLINSTFYNEATGFYHDVELSTKKHVAVYGPEGWIPLWAGIASSEQAESIKNIVMDTSKFNTFVPLPTFDASHQDFNPRNGYWRGPVWLDQAYFAIEGLKQYGFQKEATELTKKIITNAEGMAVKGQPLYENYHPISGEGLNAPHFSWTAAHLLMMISE